MKRLALVLAVAAALSASVTTAGAQDNDQAATPDACPESNACTVYTYSDGSEDTFAFDPDEGVYQEVVVEEWTTTVRFPNGAEILGRVKIKLAGFLENGDGYELVKEHVEAREGIYADADLGESFGLAELR